MSCLFVYGTLLPGETRWHFLEGFVVGDGRADSLLGQLFDTGLGYPAARVTGVDHAVDPLSRPITGEGIRAWVYEYGADPSDDIELTRIVSGDWSSRTLASQPEGDPC